MKKKRGRGVLKGGISYPGPKEITSQTLPLAVRKELEAQEERLGVSKTALTAFAIRKVKLCRYSLADIRRDIESAASEIEATVTAKRAARWKQALAK